MAKQNVTFIFEDPNVEDALARMLRSILIEKLASQEQHPERRSHEDRSILPGIHR